MEKPNFVQGQRVRLIRQPSRIGVIEDVLGSNSKDMYEYKVFMSAGDDDWYEESELVHVDKKESSPTSALTAQRIADLEAFQCYLACQKLKHPLSDHLYSFKAARIEFYPHQYRPLLKVLRNPRSRILIADEVGLGKTIEAGLIYKELKSRSALNRVLVICPSALRVKWQKELKTKFGEEFEIINSTSFVKFLNDIEEPDQWNKSLHAITSLQGLRSENILQKLATTSCSFDLIIVDEAHHLRNSRTASYKLLDQLSDDTDALIFLTATPVNLRDRDLFNLLKLLQPEEFNDYLTFQKRIFPNRYVLRALRELSDNDDKQRCLDILRKVELTPFKSYFLTNTFYKFAVDQLQNEGHCDHEGIVDIQRALRELNTVGSIMTRTRKREVRFDTMREPHDIEVEWDEAEYDFYNKIIDFVRIEMLYRGAGGAAVTFAAINLQRMAASCLPATFDYIKEASENGRYEWTEEIDEEEFEDDDSLVQCSSREIIGFEHSPHVRKLLLLGEKVLNDNKLDKFVEILQGLSSKGVNKFIVFSFFRKTLKYLEETLSDLYHIFVIHGGVKVDNREEIIEEFRTCKRPSILLMSEVGAEGLDFQFCNCLINYDMPWNPMRVEQRIGRLDRFGQKSDKILIYNFKIPNTIETRIFDLLYERIEIFKRSIGDLEYILGDHVRKLHSDILNPELTPDQLVKKTEDIAKSILNREKDYVEIERESDELISENDFTAREVDIIAKENKYVTPVELETVLLWGVNQYFPETTISLGKGSPGKRLMALRVGRDLTKAVQRIRAWGNTDKAQIFRESAAFYDNNSVNITTDPDTAFGDSKLHLVHPKHAVVSVIQYKVENEKHPSWASSLLLKDSENKGVYFFSIFRINFLTKLGTDNDNGEQVLRSIVLNLENNKQNKALSQSLISHTSSFKKSDNKFSYASEKIYQLVSLTREYIDKIITSEIDKKSSFNESKIESQLASLTVTFERKRIMLNRKIEKLKREGKIKGMELNKNQLFSLEAKFENTKDIIESRRDIVPSKKMVALGFLEVV